MLNVMGQCSSAQVGSGFRAVTAGTWHREAIAGGRAALADLGFDRYSNAALARGTTTEACPRGVSADISDGGCYAIRRRQGVHDHPQFDQADDPVHQPDQAGAHQRADGGRCWQPRGESGRDSGHGYRQLTEASWKC